MKSKFWKEIMGGEETEHEHCPLSLMDRQKE
jgi:hypothetical protein